MFMAWVSEDRQHEVRLVLFTSVAAARLRVSQSCSDSGHQDDSLNILSRCNSYTPETLFRTSLRTLGKLNATY